MASGQGFGLGRLPLMVMAGWLWLTMAGCASLTTYNSATQRQDFIFIPTGTEVRMGQDVHTKLLNEYDLIEHTDQARRIREIGQRVAAVSDRQDYTYHFYLIREDELNAFTTPGGHIYIFDGLVKRLKTDDRIAGVLAHEVGHCAARHAIKKFQGAMAYNVIGGLVFSQLGLEAEEQKLLSMTTDGVISLIFSAYSRQDEYEADRLALKYAAAAGYRPQGLAEALGIIEEASGASQIPLFLRTHPYLHDRIKIIRERVAARSD